jgi:hypothetical protein
MGQKDLVRGQVLALYKENYRGFGPTLASEEMAEREGIGVKVETLRQTLKTRKEIQYGIRAR